MTVKECILATAAKVGVLDEVQKYFNGTDSTGENTANVLLQCFNLVQNELALDYLPLIREDEVYVSTGVVQFSALTKSPVRIVDVTDGKGESVEYSVFPEYVKAQPGKLKIVYTYIPEDKEFNNEAEAAAQASTRLFSYGMAVEYCLANGLFEEANVWDKKYRDAIRAAYRIKPCKVIQSRRWV
ncbi:MAG: hypothetical protein IJV85_02520 [Clostridia bacterium]|nr:hypothetical protein [Clostridia bacterium]